MRVLVMWCCSAVGQALREKIQDRLPPGPLEQTCALRHRLLSAVRRKTPKFAERRSGVLSPTFSERFARTPNLLNPKERERYDYLLGLRRRAPRGR